MSGSPDPEQQPRVTLQPQLPQLSLTQPKIAFLLSIIALGGVIYTATDALVRHQVEFDALKKSYTNLSEGQAKLKDEVRSLRVTVDGEIRHMTAAVNRLSDAMENNNESRMRNQE